MKPTISICIPTFNRKEFLLECLQSITFQFKNKTIMKKVEIIISDNASTDGTKKLVLKYKKKFNNIYYFRNNKNIGGIKNAIKAAKYAKGDYIWFFSDDDRQKDKAIDYALKIISKFKPDALYINLDLTSKDCKKIIDPNVFRADKDSFVTDRRSLFVFLERKFFLPIDWYLTCLSCMLIKCSIFHKESKNFPSFNDNKYLFPHSSLIYYSDKDRTLYLSSKRLILFRSDNRSFGHVDKLKFLTDWYHALNTHYEMIYQVNSQYMSIKFKILFKFKIFLRVIRLSLITYFKIDISTILMKLFYR